LKKKALKIVQESIKEQRINISITKNKICTTAHRKKEEDFTLTTPVPQ
jgi:uncharacterized membrane protein YfhO